MREGRGEGGEVGGEEGGGVEFVVGEDVQGCGDSGREEVDCGDCQGSRVVRRWVGEGFGREGEVGVGGVGCGKRGKGLGGLCERTNSERSECVLVDA